MKFGLLAVLALLSTAQANAQFCEKWGTPKVIGTTDRDLSEISGMVISTNFADTMYTHNDSGSGASFYRSHIDGSASEEIAVRGGSPSDVEDIAYGPCPGKAESRCIFLADIGDNFGWRGSLSITAVEETASMPREVRSHSRISLSYPRGGNNAEAFAVHPNGDFYIVVKDKSNPQGVYRFAAADVAKGNAQGKLLGQLDMKKYLNDDRSDSRVTGMDMSADGKKFVVLTYAHAVEFNIDLGAVSSISKSLVKGKDFSVASLKRLEQQESIAYLPGNESFVYSSEGGSQEILQVDCQR